MICLSELGAEALIELIDQARKKDGLFLREATSGDLGRTFERLRLALLQLDLALADLCSR